jgi:hypothetical protein
VPEKDLSIDLKGLGTVWYLSSKIWKGEFIYMAGSASFLGSVRRFFRDYLLVMEARGPFGQLVQRATEDTALRQRLLQAPKQVMAEAGVTLPEGLEVEIVENTDKVIHLVLPPLVEARETEGGAR